MACFGFRRTAVAKIDISRLLSNATFLMPNFVVFHLVDVPDRNIHKRVQNSAFFVKNEADAKLTTFRH